MTSTEKRTPAMIAAALCAAFLGAASIAPAVAAAPPAPAPVVADQAPTAEPAVATEAPAHNAAPAPPKGAVKEPAPKEKVHVYTNADLAKFDPIPTQQAPIAQPSGDFSDWKSINAFIDRERAYEQQRLDREMARERLNREDSARRRAEEYPSYALPLSVYSYYPGVCPYYGCGGHGGEAPADQHVRAAVPAGHPDRRGPVPGIGLQLGRAPRQHALRRGRPALVDNPRPPQYSHRLMPIYEYKCAACGAILEVLQRMHDKPLKKCEACGGALEKMISRSSFQLKGSGWYVTDYARKGKGRSESDGSSSSTSEGSGSKKSGSSSSSSGGSDSKKSGS